MICDICDKKEARTRHITRSYGKQESLLIIENVPVVSCPHCGASYMAADTVLEIERIKLHQKSFSRKRSVPVAAYS